MWFFSSCVCLICFFYDLLSCIINIGKYEFKAHSIRSEVFSFVVLGSAPSSAMCCFTNLLWCLERSLWILVMLRNCFAFLLRGNVACKNVASLPWRQLGDTRKGAALHVTWPGLYLTCSDAVVSMRCRLKRKLLPLAGHYVSVQQFYQLCRN